MHSLLGAYLDLFLCFQVYVKPRAEAGQKLVCILNSLFI